MVNGDKSSFVKVHLLPGRMRLNVPGLQRNQAMAGKLAKRLSTIPGLREAKVNPITGQVLIIFDPERLTARQLLNALFRLPALPTPPTVPAQQPSWHAMGVEEVTNTLVTNPQLGLTQHSVLERHKKYGPNLITDRVPLTFRKMLLEPLQGFMSKLLLLSAAGSMILGQTSDALVIVVIVGLQALMEAAQQHRAEKSLSALKKLSAPMAKVIRDGKNDSIPARDLVPGDIVIMEAGDRVPADCRLLEVSNMMTDESALTGESVPVLKDNGALNKHLCTADRLNMVFFGTSVTGGRGKAVVVSTGMFTEMGQIAHML
ncbi:MAG: HAD-IC family P-type ATPase, partial [Bacillota bacterium]